jgi:hypothetical protein
VADPDKATVSKFAKAYQADEAMLKAAGENRYTVLYRPHASLPTPHPSSKRSAITNDRPDDKVGDRAMSSVSSEASD